MPADDRSGVGLGAAEAPMRLPMLLAVSEPVLLLLRGDWKDLALEELRLSGLIVLPIERSVAEGVRLGAGVETDGRDESGRTDGLDGRGVTEVLGRLELTDGLDRLNDGLADALGRLALTDGLDRPIDGLGDGLGRLGAGLDRLTDGPGLGVDLAGLDIRFTIPLLGALGRGADWAIGADLRLTCGLLGRELKDLDPADLPGLIPEGREGAWGAARMLGAALLTLGVLGREAVPLELLRPRIWPCACGPISRAIPTTIAATEEPHARRFARAAPAARWFFWSTANIFMLLSPRR